MLNLKVDAHRVAVRTCSYVGATVTKNTGREDRMLRRHSLAALSLFAFTLGCDAKTPMQPSQPATTVTGLAITGADAVVTGSSASYSVTATFGDGSTRTILPAWTISNPAVASVDSMGRVEGRTHGSTTLTAAYNGQSASKIVQVFNNYGGTWEGRYIVRVCSDTGDFTDHDGGWCKAGPERVGSVLGIAMTLVQSGGEVTGTLPCCRGTIAGVVRPDGRLNLSGLVTDPDFDYPEIALGTLQVGPWESNLEQTGGMTGQWTWVYTSFAGRKGTLQTENEFVTMTRVSANAVDPSAMLPSRRALLPQHDR